MKEVGSGATTSATASSSAAASPATTSGDRAGVTLGGPVARFVDKLFQPVDASSLGAFRVQFGVLMLWEVVRYLAEDRVGRHFLEPRFLFTYEFFPFVAPWPGSLLYVHFAAMAVCAVGIAIGLFTRLSILLFGLGYSYVFLLDRRSTTTTTT